MRTYAFTIGGHHDRTPVGWLLDALTYYEEAAALDDTGYRMLLAMRDRQGEAIPWDEMETEDETL